MPDDVNPDAWYSPDMVYLPEAPGPSLTVLPIDLEFGAALYKADIAGSAEEVPVRVASGPLVASPWLQADAGIWMFDAAARELIEPVVGPGEVWWLAVEASTPDRLVTGYEVPMHGRVVPDVFCECHSTYGPNGTPIRWVLNPAKMDGREFLVAPGTRSGGVVMKGSLLLRLIALGAQGVIPEKARVCPNSR